MHVFSSTQKATSYTVVVPAAGVGSRMAADRPKQYLPLAGKTVLEQTLFRLQSHPSIEHVVVVISPQDDAFYSLPIAGADWLTVVKGGKERSDSVLNGLLASSEPWVLVHDAARPCVRHNDISQLLTLADGQEGGILAKQASDTIKLANDNQINIQTSVEKSLPRARIWHALTPQFFPRQQLIDALQWCVKNNIPVTDEASAIEQTGGAVHLVPGAQDNIKITHPEDLALAEFYLKQQTINKTGTVCYE